ncbi:hypothetical protein DICPUDRAFT_92912 [Dictyostelium purpureum]|uniref:Cytochrome P450 family protein n=1 Tax=Dictyostelium purpureum TaxID=5786 RepID=F0ZZ56_DICPU|nr:uncharacterized protein DICPUDRAFT_92912 [Dictyostelium purpureum]EGC30784.1 hypothetical protein DICPUDRAFT_92912 [Dictyostelium purpureum]|eukprot:XP_003292700.1 hypothetical protein DICPUDRAFT_92912 [Dictyostelium purpureum]
MFLLKLICYLILFYFIRTFIILNKKINKKEPNGPLALPLIGNIHQFKKAPHHLITKMEKEFGNKGIVRIYIGDTKAFFISDLELIKEIFIHNWELFNNRPKTPTLNIGTNGYRGINGAHGECWEKNKKIISKAIRKANIKHIYSLLDTQVEELIKSMSTYETKKTNFNPKLYIRKFVLSTMLKYIFNEKLPLDDDLKSGSVYKLTNEMEKIFKLLSVSRLGDHVKIFQSIFYYYLKKTDKNFKTLKNLIIEKYNEHLKSFNKESPRDLLDILIDNYEMSTNMDDILNITQVTLDIFLAGTDTSSNSLVWLILKLVNYPEHQEKAYNEIKNAIQNGRDKVLLSDRPNTPYLQAIIKEVYRMHPIVVFGLPRLNNQDVYIKDHFIPKNSYVFINYHSIGYNENYYNNPCYFDPSRFLGPTPETHFPFGLGPRNCLGQQLAQDQIYLCIANILLKFKLLPIDGNFIDENENFGLTMRPNDFKINLESR